MSKLVVITACPTGVALTHLAAEVILETAHGKNIDVLVERQSIDAIENALDFAAISAADAVLIASDIPVDATRFKGKPIDFVSTKKAIQETDAVLEQALAASLNDPGKPINRDQNWVRRTARFLHQIFQ
ncbi:MAG: hypothetical protein F6K17_38195 [Okeania sp. SIO3C4]|nr:hypothetical protein [Okeania sp. SIO3C4]